MRPAAVRLLSLMVRLMMLADRRTMFDILSDSLVELGVLSLVNYRVATAIVRCGHFVCLGVAGPLLGFVHWLDWHLREDGAWLVDRKRAFVLYWRGWVTKPVFSVFTHRHIQVHGLLHLLFDGISV